MNRVWGFVAYDLALPTTLIYICYLFFRVPILSVSPCAASNNERSREAGTDI